MIIDNEIISKLEFRLDLHCKTGIMGILNVTPDSFSDGGSYFEADDAVRQGKLMFNEGADIIDVGGESTRPGAEPVSLEEELRRVIPVVERLASQGIPVSIDTSKSQVARRALEAGAIMVNDITGLRADPDMVKIAAEYSAFLVIMHIKGQPRTMQSDTTYLNLIGEIRDYLQAGIEMALSAGVTEDKIIIDPGLGFGKSFQQNLEIIRQIGRFKELGYPVLLGPSRKAFLGAILDCPPRDRMLGSAAACALAAAYGADWVRVHDVPEIAQVMKVSDYIVGKMSFHEEIPPRH